MKNYFLVIYKYHKKNMKLYIALLIGIYGYYLLNLKTPISFILGDYWYWSKGLTRASISILKLDFNTAFRENPLIYLVIIILIYYIFLEPIRYKFNKR